MKFLIDAQLPRKLAWELEARGVAADHIFDLLPEFTSDLTIAREAARRGAIIISKDQDFCDLLRQGRLGTPLLWLRTGNMTNRELWRILEPLWNEIERRFEAGAMLVEVADVGPAYRDGRSARLISPPMNHT